MSLSVRGHCATIVLVAIVAGTLSGFLAREPLRQLVVRLFGPPRVQMTESFAERGDGPTLDHTIWDGLLRQHVTEHGGVDYRSWSDDPTALDRYLASLAEVDLAALGRSERLALLINAYNAFTIRLILDHDGDGGLKSIRDIPDAERWDAVRWELGGQTWSLNQIEHEQIRPRFAEPRIHFALVCAAYSCPPLRTEAYVGVRLEEQLEDQTRRVHGDERWFHFDAETGVVRFTELYDWYLSDFEQVAESAIAYMAGYSSPLNEALEAGRSIDLRRIPYEWDLNRKPATAP